MTDLYSPALGVAIVAVVGSLGSALLRRPRIGVATGSAALVLAALAAASHVALGHAPGSAAALGFGAFLREHPAAWITAAAGAAGLLLSLRAAGTRRGPVA